MLPAALESIADLTSFAEIRSFGLHTLLSKRNRAEAQQAGLTYSVHGPFGYTGIWDLDDAERLKALDEHRRHLEASAEIGALLYVVHPDWRPEVKPRDPAVVAQLDRSFETLLEWQDELGVEIVVENMPGAGHVALHAPGRPRPARPRPHPRRGPRQHQRLPRGVARRPARAAAPPARARQPRRGRRRRSAPGARRRRRGRGGGGGPPRAPPAPRWCSSTTPRTRCG